ncbi:MAG: hypothetical protein RLZZ387_5071 [Chloroflexota bacterium]|jgi:hypothetical protein
MSLRIEYLEEPKLEFGHGFEHEDTKTGLAEYGPFGKTVAGLHPSEIKIGFIGTRETIASAKEWITHCGSPIESENIKRSHSVVVETGLTLFGEPLGINSSVTRLAKILNRDFIGFSRESPFGCCFQTNPRWERPINPRDLDSVLEIDNKVDRIWRLVDLFDTEIASLAHTGPTPDIIVLALTPAILGKAHAVKLSGNFYLNFRRAIKARAMQWGIPIQLLRYGTATGQGSGLQEPATRAWNFCTAQYYKTDGIPWRPTTLEANTCYVGISFFVAQDLADRLTMRSSVAQAFDYLGQGLVLRGDPFEWDETKLGRTPHLTKDAARKLIKEILDEYVRINRMPPSRVVIHKTSEFWGAKRGIYNELDGLYEGIADVFPRCQTDFVALRQTGLYLFREGKFPPLRGTYFCVEEQAHFLYTMGYIPYLETYPGAYVPEPWQIIEHHGGSSPKELFREILSLTKMNVNNCAFADGSPITLSFARMVGEIMKHVSKDGKVQPQYKFYM